MVKSKVVGEVRAPLTFIVRQDTKPYFNSSALTGGLPEIFYETENQTVTIHDMRAKPDELDLDRNGFELRRSPTAVGDLYDDDAMERYDREIENLLRSRSNLSFAMASLLSIRQLWPPPRGASMVFAIGYRQVVDIRARCCLSRARRARRHRCWR